MPTVRDVPSCARAQAGMARRGAQSQRPSRPAWNHLEALSRDRIGQHSIRVNDQFRLCFTWTVNGPENVECVDYH